MDIVQYWQAVLAQQPQQMRRFFDPEAAINWHNTGEQFTAEESTRANCAYPGRWNGRLERVETLPDRIITAVQVLSRDGRISCHVTSFMQLRQDRILTLDEYWGDDGEAPRWRQQMQLGRALGRPQGQTLLP